MELVATGFDDISTRYGPRHQSVLPMITRWRSASLEACKALRA